MKRIPVNLASRPIEAVRRAQAGALVAGAAVLALTLAHVALGAWLARPLSAIADEDAPAVTAAQLEQWREEVSRLAAAGEPQRARSVAEAARLADELIAWRAFPWNEMFRDLELILPDDVRLERIQPVSDAEGVQVELTAATPERSALRELLVRLVSHARFADVLPLQESTGDDGLHRIALTVRYRARTGQLAAGGGR